MMRCGKRPSEEPPRADQGVAVIIVLGLMSMLMMTAVAFSISMRVERVGASHYRHGTQARHMLRTALVNALAEIDDDMVSGEKVYPSWDYTNSMGSQEAQVFTASVTNFIPSSLYGVLGLQGENPTPVTADWQYIEDQDGVVRGRYAYVALNVSGLLDANRAFGGQHMAGTNAEEIAVLPYGSEDFVEAAEFKAEDVRYETLAEFQSMNTPLADAIPGGFAMYSLTRTGSRLNVADWSLEDKVSLALFAGNDATVDSPLRASIIATLLQSVSNATSEDAAFMFSNLVDYVDADCVPSDLGSACTEAVPMINEVEVDSCMVIELDRGEFSLHAEWWYPFIKLPVKSSFRLEGEVGGFWTNETTQGSVGIESTVSFDADVSKIRSFGADSVLVQTTFPAGWQTQEVVHAEIEFRGRIVTADGNSNIVDSVPYPWREPQADPPPLRFVSKSFTLTTEAQGPFRIGGLECGDPRFNWYVEGPPYDKSSWTPTTEANVTLGAVNKGATEYINVGKTAFGTDDTLDMYVSDSGRLLSAAELGHLLRGAKVGAMGGDWFQTVRLYDIKDFGKDSVLEHFTALPIGTLERGRVNINTPDLDVLAAVFRDAPLGCTNAPLSLARLSWTQADRLADGIVNATAAAPFLDVGRIGGAGKGKDMDIDWRSILSSLTDLERESVIVHSERLLTTRHNLFLLFLKSEAYSAAIGGAEYGGETLATGRGLVEVWRDPFPGSGGGHNACLVRYFRFLED